MGETTDTSLRDLALAAVREALTGSDLRSKIAVLPYVLAPVKSTAGEVDDRGRGTATIQVHIDGETLIEAEGRYDGVVIDPDSVLPDPFAD